MPITPYKFDPEKAESYIDFCRELYRCDANWIPPLRSRLAQFSRDFSFYRQPGNDHQHFLAAAAGKTVGHVSAMVNAQLKGQDGEAIGLVGFFECVEEQAVARELLAQASHWLRTKHGVRRIWGPMQFDIWHGYRLMTRGYDGETFFGEPYNKPYYPGLFENHGFAVRKYWYSFTLSGRASLRKLIEPWAKEHARALTDGYYFTPIDIQDVYSVTALHSIIERSYHGFLGITRLEFAEFNEVFAGYAGALDPRFAIGGWDGGGNLCGFAIAYPDQPSVPRSMRAVLFMLGITPEESRRRRGLGRALCHHSLSALLEAGFSSLVVALLADDSPAWSMFGRYRNDAPKQYALYEALLEP
jgi:hypothetical protein